MRPIVSKIITFLILLAIVLPSFAQKGAREFYEIKMYRLKDDSQVSRVEEFIKGAYLPALHRKGIKNVGVMEPFGSDSLSGKRIFIVIPFKSLEQFQGLEESLLSDAAYLTAGKEYLDAVYDNPPYERIESTLLKAWAGMTKMETPSLTSPRSERIYELRSYESPTQKIYRNKVKMFNDGDEIGLFRKLKFNAVFYADVLSGSRMPNLMYMTTFDNQVSHDEHWKAFVDDPHWKRLIAMPEYAHNVSKINIYLLRPTEYSDY